VLACAARHGHVNIIDEVQHIDFVNEVGEVLGAELLTDALNCAGAFGQLQAAQ
jgi:hypothetical protein